MARLFRTTDTNSIEVYDVSIDKQNPAEVQTHVVEEGVPITDHRQPLAREVLVRAPINAALGVTARNDLLAWILESEQVGLFVLFDDGTEFGPATLGSWSETITIGRRELTLPLTERRTATASGNVVFVEGPQRRTDQRNTRDDGKQTGRDVEPRASTIVELGKGSGVLR